MVNVFVCLKFFVRGSVNTSDHAHELTTESALVVASILAPAARELGEECHDRSLSPVPEKPYASMHLTVNLTRSKRTQFTSRSDRKKGPDV